MANEPNLDENNMEIDDDAMSLGSISNVLSEKLINNACQNNLENVEVEIVKNVDNLENIESIENENVEVEIVKNVDNVENIESNENENVDHIALYTDENIDVNRLNSIEVNGRGIVNFGHVFAELQRLSCHWINECRVIDLCITKTKRHGLKTQYFVECRVTSGLEIFLIEGLPLLGD
ncbi:hypothetical protein PUN28_013922 [Cardiocondyla obscurior]|uniref:Uncharacterized protein n=1 Tax=Cardiocondyla obscurior TaxID=286306 RepID=A0AAW2F5B7_9HYME